MARGDKCDRPHTTPQPDASLSISTLRTAVPSSSPETARPPAGRFFWRHPPPARLAGVACRMDRLPAIRPLHGTQDRGARPSRDALGLDSRRNNAVCVKSSEQCDERHRKPLLPGALCVRPEAQQYPPPLKAARSPSGPLFLSRVGFVCFVTRIPPARRLASLGSLARRARQHAQRQPPGERRAAPRATPRAPTRDRGSRPARARRSARR